MFEKETLEDAILYLLKSHPEITPAEMVARLYIADVYHLLLFGRTITNSVQDTRYMFMDIEDMEGIYEKIKGRESDFEYLSETDRKSLEFAYDRGELEKDGYGLFPIPIWDK